MREQLVVDDGLGRVMLVVGMRVLLLRRVHLVVHHLLRHVHIWRVTVLLGVIVRLWVRRIVDARVHRRCMGVAYRRLR